MIDDGAAIAAVASRILVSKEVRNMLNKGCFELAGSSSARTWSVLSRSGRGFEMLYPIRE